MNVALWIVQVLLAVAFGGAGFIKSTTPLADLGAKMDWVNAVPPGLVRFIGICELAAAIGLVLPALTRIAPRLTPLAASGLVVIMVLAMGFHASRGEMPALPFNLVLGALAAFVAWGRFQKVPIAPRA